MIERVQKELQTVALDPTYPKFQWGVGLGPIPVRIKKKNSEEHEPEPSEEYNDPALVAPPWGWSDRIRKGTECSGVDEIPRNQKTERKKYVFQCLSDRSRPQGKSIAQFFGPLGEGSGDELSDTEELTRSGASDESGQSSPERESSEGENHSIETQVSESLPVDGRAQAKALRAQAWRQAKGKPAASVLIEQTCDLDPECNRILVECCTHVDSTLSQTSKYSTGCQVFTITKQDDLISAGGLRKAIRACSFIGTPTLAYASIPCTSGCSWHRINRARNRGTEKISEGRREFKKLWKQWTIVAQHCHESGGWIAFEWPRDCELWNMPCVERFVKIYGLLKVEFHGCSLGVCADNDPNQPIFKPWIIATNCTQLLSDLCKYRCPNIKYPNTHTHTICQGSRTKLTERYPPLLAHVIHNSFSLHCETWNKIQLCGLPSLSNQ